MSRIAPRVSFKDRDHSKITSVVQLRNALVHAGIDPDHHIIWDEDRKVVPTFGIYVVTPLDNGTYSLDIRDRGDVNHRGTYTTEMDVVRGYLGQANPKPPPDQARVRAAMQRDYVDNREERERMKAEDHRMVARVLRERAEGGAPRRPPTKDHP